MTYLAPTPKMQCFAADGTPLVGGKLYSYAAGTTTPLATYTNYGGSTPNSNPVILDSRGEASVWLSASSYKLKLTDATGVEIWTVDNVVGFPAISASDITGVLPITKGGTGQTTAAAALNALATVGTKDYVLTGSGTNAIWQSPNDKSINPANYPYNADPTGVAYADTAFNNAWAAFMADSSYSTFYIPPGTFKFANAIDWDCAPRANTGIKVAGGGQLQTILNITGVTTATPFKIWNSNGSSIGSVGVYFSEFRNFSVHIYSSSPALFGTDNGYDALQSCLVENVSVLNYGGVSAGTALRINGSNASSYINLQAGSTPATPSYAGLGVGLEMTMCTFSSFIGCSIGNANTGVLFTQNGNSSLGFSYANVFTSIDVENVQYGIKNTSPNSSDNVFVGGVLNLVYAGGYAAYSTSNAYTGANALTLDNVRLTQDPSLGATLYYIDPANYYGISWRGRNAFLTYSYSVPASGSGNTVTNTTGHTINVQIWGGAVSTVYINGFGIGTLSTGANMSFNLNPGGTIAMTYATAPSWLWYPITL